MKDCSENLVTIVADIRYAKVMVKALDFYVRMGIGQVKEIQSLISIGQIPSKNGIVDSFIVEHALSDLSFALGFHPNGSFGIGSRSVTQDTHAAYELERVLQKALAEHFNPNPSLRGVNYDGLVVRYTNLPAPTAKIALKP